jgi:hypothetical protein
LIDPSAGEVDRQLLMDAPDDDLKNALGVPAFADGPV